jgi:hypothetical protein
VAILTGAYFGRGPAVQKGHIPFSEQFISELLGQAMFKIFSAAFAALVLVSCGGGADSTLSASASREPLQAKMVSPGHTLFAEQVSVVNTTTTGNQVLRSIGATSDGGYVVAWISSGSTLYIQAYDSSGAKTGAETPIPLDVQAPTQNAAVEAIEASSVAVLNDGTVVVAYRVSRNTDQPDGTVLTKTGVYIQRFDANGIQLMGETEVASREEVVHSRSPFINQLTTAALSDGGFVVGWAVATFSAQFGSISTLALRRFDSQGQPVGSPVEVGQFPALTYRIVADAHGGFTLSASQLDNFFSTEVWAFHYDANQIARQIVAPRFGAALLLPLEGGYVLFASGSAGPTAQMLDNQGNPIGTPTTIPSMPVAARELADGSYVAIWPAGGSFAAQRFAADGTPMGEPLAIASNAAVLEMVALADTGFAAAWSAASGNGDTDVYTQRFIEASSDRKKACLNSAKGLKGRERKDFINACLA